MRMRGLLMLFLACTACSAAHPTTTTTPASRPVAAASPPKDDGKAAQGGSGGENHAAALEQLKVAPLTPLTARPDKQNSVLVRLPDPDHWTRVRFLTLKSLVGFRYGKDHHAIFGGFVTHVEDNSAQGACNKSFEHWAQPYIDAFEVELVHEPPVAFPWSPIPPPKTVKKVAIVDIDAVHAKTATVLARESYEAAWAAYPAWNEHACLIVGVAIPARDEPQRAKEVRDRFVREVFPNLLTTSPDEPKESY